MLAKKTIAILMINAVVLNPSSVVSVEKKAHKMGSNVQATRTMETNSGALEDLPVSIMNMVHEKFLSSKLQKIFKFFFSGKLLKICLEKMGVGVLVCGWGDVVLFEG